MSNKQSFQKVLNPGATRCGHLFVTIKFDGQRLSVTGVEGPMANGDARGSCGQCVDALDEIVNYSKGWDKESAAKLRDIWKRWHLNDMRPGCEHQREWDTKKTIEVVSYGLTSEAYRLRESSIAAVALAAAKGEPIELSETARALILLEKWFKDVPQPPDADSPLSGCFDVKKRETKSAGWVRPEEHPDGLLTKPCPECGYKYGSRWNMEEVPKEILQELMEFPSSNLLPASWR